MQSIRDGIVSINESLQEQSEAERRSKQSKQPEQVSSPTIISIPEGVEVRKNATDQAGDNERHAQNLLIQRSIRNIQKWTLIAVSVYAAVATFQWFQMKRATDIAAEAFTTDARPYVVIDNVKRNFIVTNKQTDAFKIIPQCFDNSGRICVELDYTVTGRTPAIGVQRVIHVISEENPINAKQKIESLITQCPQQANGWPPMSTGSHQWIDSSAETFTPEQAERIVNDKAIMYVYGAIQYRDLFLKCHVTRFCFVQPVQSQCPDKGGCSGNCEYGNWIDRDEDLPKSQ